MLTSQCPGKDLIKAQAKPFFFACMNLVVLNHMDNSYSKWKCEKYVPKTTSPSQYTNPQMKF